MTENITVIQPYCSDFFATKDVAFQFLKPGGQILQRDTDEQSKAFATDASSVPSDQLQTNLLQSFFGL